MDTCHFCKSKISGLSYTCKFCNKKFCPKDRLPENHECKGLEKKNLFEQSSEKRKNKKDIWEAHYFVTRVFNVAFNDFISSVSEAKVVGFTIGGLHEFGEVAYHPKYSLGQKLIILRDYLLTLYEVNEELFHKLIPILHELLKSSYYDKKLREGILDMILEIKKEYGVDLTFDFMKLLTKLS